MSMPGGPKTDDRGPEAVDRNEGTGDREKGTGSGGARCSPRRCLSPFPGPGNRNAEAPHRGSRAWDALANLSPLLALGVLVAVVTAMNPRFVSPANLLNILHAWSFVGVIAIGMTFVILQGGIDLSVGSLVAFAGGLGIWLMNTVLDAAAISAAPQSFSGIRVALADAFNALGWAGSEGVAIALAFALILLTGLLAGAVNGLLITKGRLAAFIATLGGLAAYRSLAQAMADGGEFRSLSPETFSRLGTGGVPIPFLTNPYGLPLVLPWPVLAFATVALLGHVVLRHTRYGRYVIAVGANETAARYSGVRVDRVKIATYTLIGALAGLAALMNASRMNAVSSGQTGVMWELDAIAAVVIGGTRMSGGAGRIWGTVVGLLILGVIANMLNLLQVSTYLQGLVKGLIIIAAVLLQRVGRPAD